MKEITPKQAKAAQLEASGMKAIDIAKECKITPQTISAYRQMDEYNVLVSKIARNTFRALQMRLVDGTKKAADTIVELLDSEDEKVRLKAAESLMKMVGMVSVEDGIGATTIAELKSEDCILGIGNLKSIHRNIDEHLDQIGIS